MPSLEEVSLLNNRSNQDISLVNSIAYPLELVCYTIILALSPTYLILSNGGYRFHSLLRLLICLLFIEIILLAVTRGIGIILRLYEAAAIVFSPNLTEMRDILTNITYSCLTHVQMTVVAIPFERLLATIRVKDYEKSFHHPIYKLLCLMYAIIPWLIINYFLYFYGGLINIWTDDVVLNALNIFAMVIYLAGFMAMEVSRRISIRFQETNVQRELSRSFQTKENLLIISIIRPIFVYLFISRIFQFITQTYMWDIGFFLGPLFYRVVVNAHNISVSFGFMLIPVLMLKSHPNLLRLTKTTPQLTTSDGEAYFRELSIMWA